MAFTICDEGPVEAKERAGAFESVPGEVEFFHCMHFFLPQLVYLSRGVEARGGRWEGANSSEDAS